MNQARPEMPAQADGPCPQRLAARSRLELTELILPQHANHYGTLFGPNALALLGKAAYLVCARHTRQPIVMAAAKRIDFLAPVPVGALLNIDARVTRVGRSSLSVRVVAAVDAAPGARPDDALRAEFEMVAVDGFGRPCPISPPPSPQEPAPAVPISR
ncbi:MAG: acyl-CoA thioesterase [Burkholderiaceae bacterium]